MDQQNQPRHQKTPEEIAAAAFSKDTAPPDFAAIAPQKKLPPHKRFAAWHRNLNKKQKFAVLIAAFLIVGGGGALAMNILNNQAGRDGSVQVKTQPETVPSKLTGLPVKPEVNERQVTAVMIENSVEARPQSGLRGAGVVFEAIAEGGITRFVALYQDTSSKYIGPVRSVRPYYLDFIKPFDAAIAHVGGSPQALNQIRSQGIKDLDQFSNSDAFRRITSRYAPHNVYTSTTSLDKAEAQRGYKKSNYTGFEHQKKEGKADKITARTINLAISGQLFDVSYTYNPKTNDYSRKVGGVAHKDERTGKTITPKVVIALSMRHSYSGGYSVYGTTGKGSMVVFQNGTAIKGTWSKKSRNSQFEFKDRNNQPIKLNPGQAWITIVQPGQTTYKP